MGHFDNLINQIDAFIRKFYKNQMIKGTFLFLIIFLFSFLVITGLEYIGRFNSIVRAILLFSFIVVNGYVLLKYFIQPLTKLFSFGKRINRYQAASIIGDFFPSVDDKLLNTLQLHDSAQAHPNNLAFLEASIKQNSKKLNSFSFTKAVDYSENKKFVKYFLPVLFTFVLIGILFPNLFSEGSERLIKYNQVFEKEPDFTFELLNDKLIVEEGNKITIEVKLNPLDGMSIPDRVYLESSEGKFLMKKIKNNEMSYTFNNLNKDVHFHFKALNFNSKEYTIELIKRTSIGHLKVELDYPKYIGRENETIENPGDLLLPSGTKLTWNGITKNSKNLTVALDDSVFSYNKQGFRFQHSVNHSTNVVFILENDKLSKHDSTVYHIGVIKDEYPSISVNRTEDSIVKNKIYFTGNVKDDYGVSKLNFTYIINKKTGDKISNIISVPAVDGKQSPFSMTFNVKNLGLELEDKLTYFFTVYDNDGVNGPKATRSSVFEYLSPSQEQLQEQRKEDKDKANEELNKLLEETKDFKEKMARLKREIANSKSTTWQQQKQLENLQKQQESLQNRIQQTKEELKSSFDEKDRLSPADEKLLEKQKLLEEMLDQLMDDELKNLLEELQKLMEEQSDKNLMELLENTEMSAEEMERQIDNTLEMLKMMDVEERVEDLINSLDNLAEEQLQLKEDFKNNEFSNEDVQSKQQELNEKFEKLKEDTKEMIDKNNELRRPMSFDDLDDLMDEISNKMKGAQENIQKGNESGAQGNQQEAGEKMEEAASQLQAQMQMSQQEQQTEDYAAMRALVENIIRLSFAQESNMEDFQSTDSFDPHFGQLGSEQRSIMDNFVPVKDSLRALANRVPQASSFIEQEVGNIDKQFKYIPTHIGEREKRDLLIKQQFVMTSFNNLALFLNEAMEAAQMQMQGMGEGEGNDGEDGQGGKGGKGNQGQPGKKGKSGQGQGGDMQGLKEMIKKQLEQMKNGQGSSPGGKQSGGILPINSQQAAKMAAEQSMIQQKLQEIREQLNKDGSGSGNQMNKLLEELEKQQQDLINKRWDNQLIERQQDILTRLLESENAQRERGWDEERESNSGKDDDFGNQIEFLEYKKQKEKQIELLRTLDPSFSRYYKEKANAYFQNIN